jgi:2-polyprenyl-3-methyl-5-hydroxy-6-metoxy-1,4-benzoquinol methylase
MADARSYWNDRYTSLTRGAASASGTFTHLEEANRWFYRAKFNRIRKILRESHVEIAHGAVLDAACGTGAFIPLWLSLGAGQITGVDLSDTAVQTCSRRFAGNARCHFRQLDLSSPASGTNLGDFDLVCIFEALFLLTRESDFLIGLHHLCSWLRPGGHLLFSDQMPEATIMRHERLTYHSRAAYDRVFAAEGVELIGKFRQSCLFNRHIFGEKLQPIVEAKCPWLLYGLDRLMLWSPVRNAPGPDEIYYCLARKKPGAARSIGDGRHLCL